jgi:hypothetical protein
LKVAELFQYDLGNLWSGLFLGGGRTGTVLGRRRRLFLDDSRNGGVGLGVRTDGSEHNDRDGHGDESTASDKQIEQSC